MPQQILDTAAFDDAATACRLAAATLRETAVLGVDPAPFAVAEIAAALGDLDRAWARELGALEGHADGLATALAVAGQRFAEAEAGATAGLVDLSATVAAIGRPR